MTVQTLTTPQRPYPLVLRDTQIGERQYFQPTMTQLVKAYEKYRPGVTVQVQELPNDNTYQTKLLKKKWPGASPTLSPTMTSCRRRLRPRASRPT